MSSYLHLMGRKIYDLLYTHHDSDGNLIEDFDDVLYLDSDKILEKRVDDLEALLTEVNDIEKTLIPLESANLLCSWGFESGVDYIEYFIKRFADELGKYSPHRIFGYETIFEEFERSLFIYHARLYDMSESKGVFARKKISSIIAVMIKLSKNVTYDMTGLVEKIKEESWREYKRPFQDCLNLLARDSTKSRVDDFNQESIEGLLKRWEKQTKGSKPLEKKKGSVTKGNDSH